MRTPALLTASLVLALVAPGRVLAQEEADPRVAEARGHFEAGDEHYAGGRYALAAQEFQRAHEILSAAHHPNAALVLFNVGRSLMQLGGHDQQARDAYARFLEETPQTAATAETVALARQHLAELDARLAGTGGGGGGGGGGGPPTPTTRASGGISPIGPILLAVGGAALVAGLVMDGVAYAQDQDHLAQCPGRVGCDESLRSAVDGTRTLAIAGDVLWITGLAVAATGLVLTFVLEDGPSADAAAIELRGVQGGGYASLRWRLP
ncbi:MAG: hypothetical protein H6719_30070 [Sandaracinaceae bacterium]|nr:hypothetical protein [Sandaracinaceae bacterium]